MPPTPAYPNKTMAKQKQEIQSTRSRNRIVFHGAVQIMTSRKMRFECEHVVQRNKLAKAEVGKNEVFQMKPKEQEEETSRKRRQKAKRKAVNCSYIQPAISRKSSNADENANKEQRKACSKGRISQKGECGFDSCLAKSCEKECHGEENRIMRPDIVRIIYAKCNRVEEKRGIKWSRSPLLNQSGHCLRSG